MTQEESKNIKEKFPTYAKAIAEIQRLQEIVHSLQLAYALSQYKRPKGRPKKPTTSKIRRLFGLSNDDATTLKKKPRGRPRQTSKEKMTIKLKEWDQFRQEIAPKIRKKTVTDKDVVEYICKKDGAKTSERRIKEISTAVLKKIGYFRDQTGIRIRKNEKPKNKK